NKKNRLQRQPKIYYTNTQIIPKYSMPTRRSSQNIVCRRADRSHMRKIWYANAQDHPKIWYADAQVSDRKLCKSTGCVIFHLLSFIPLTTPSQKRRKRRRCLTGVNSRSKRSSKFVSVDEKSNHEIVHVLRLRKAQRAADEALDPGPQIDVFALNFLDVLLAYLMLLVGPPAVGVT